MSNEVSYQFRFGFELEDVNAIFSDPEIARNLESVITENRDFILEQISKVRFFLVPLLKSKELKSMVLLDDAVNAQFMEITKNKILWKSVNQVFVKRKFDVKENILNLLSDSNGMQEMIKEIVVAVFSGITQYDYDDELNKLV